MANELDALLSRVEDETLRQDLKVQIDRLQRKRQFGLVFEEHLPERVILPQHPIRRGTKVVLREHGADSDPRLVLKVVDEVAALAALEGEQETIAVSDLVAVAEFGDPVYPGLKRLGSIDRGGDKPAHIIIKGENHHALEALQFTHAGKIDCIYIDPPYNTGAKDWKYNNNYVDADDAYRHSKWLAMMQRRLLLAKQLLNPDDSVLIVTIDEKEYLRLGLLLGQLFTASRIQMVTSVISAKGTMRKREFSRVAEHIFFVLIGDAAVVPWEHNMLDGGQTEQVGQEVDWLQLRRREPTSTRKSRPNQFYPIFVNQSDGTLHSIGDALAIDIDHSEVKGPSGTISFWPINTKGREMVWGLTPNALRARRDAGYFRLRNWKPQLQKVSFQYLPSGTIEAIETGRISLTGRESDGSVRAFVGTEIKGALPKTVWTLESHNAEIQGTLLLSSLLVDRRFPFPKSLFAVEDALRFFVKDKPGAIIVDFFAGSGTTTHAVARLNRQDGGRRQSISVTNNEVSEDETNVLTEAGHTPGEPEWERSGIFEFITRPRITAAITGTTPDGEPIKGNYKFTDEFPIAEGFEENVEFVELTYLDAEEIELDMAFAGIAPLLWLRAGGQGPVIEECLDSAGRRKPYAMTGRYAVLFNPDRWRSFVDKIPASVKAIFVVTDSASTFAGIAAELPSGVDVVRLYENYLTTFAINHGGHTQ